MLYVELCCYECLPVFLVKYHYTFKCNFLLLSSLQSNIRIFYTWTHFYVFLITGIVKVAIIVPYRDREDHLRTFLLNIHRFLQRQQNEYGIYIVEQVHRRRMEREAKAKAVAAVRGADFVQFLALLAVLHRSVWKKRLTSSYIIYRKYTFFWLRSWGAFYGLDSLK